MTVACTQCSMLNALHMACGFRVKRKQLPNNEYFMSSVIKSQRRTLYMYVFVLFCRLCFWLVVCCVCIYIHRLKIWFTIFRA